jgi:hypothetical protein
MPLRRRVVVSTAGLLLFVGACVSAPNSATPLTSSRPTQSGQILSAEQRDSLFAQLLAEREGPRVHVSAEFANISAGSRRVRAHVRLDDDAYVVVGQITPDGVLRIVFPEEPSDDGFLRGRQSYETAEFFAGFTDQYRYRAASSQYGRFGPATRDSYDNGYGFLFVVASWRPMRLDRFSTGGSWDSFELLDSEYMRDPRPAVYELAALLAGVNREAYTVEFANYTTTRYAYEGLAASRSAYGYGFCSGFSPYGFASSPFGSFSVYNSLLPYGQSFYYRGQYYAYNAFGDCYTIQSPYMRYGYGGYIIAQAPPLYPRRPFDLGARNPIAPQPPRARLAADAAKATDGSTSGAMASPSYRTRGLLTSDTPDPRRAAGSASTSDPRRASGSEPATRTRPAIQDMVGDHFDGRQGFTRAQLAGDDGNPRTPRTQPRFETPSRGRETNNNESRGYTRPAQSDDARPTPRTESPRIESPRSEPRSESPRVIAPPPPRTETPSPRVEMQRSAPPPAPAPKTEAPPPKPPEVKPPGR